MWIDTIASYDMTTIILIGVLAVVFLATIIYLAAKVPLVWTIARFGYSNAIYNSRINRFVQKIYLLGLLETADISEASNYISSVNSRDFPVKSADSPEDIERLLVEKLHQRYSEAVALCPKSLKSVLDANLIKYENQALKSIFTSYFKAQDKEGGTRASHYEKVPPIGNLSEGVIKDMLNAETLKDLIDLIPREDIREQLNNRKPEHFHDAEMILDNYYLNNLTVRIKKAPSPLRKELTDLQMVNVDLHNMRALMRMVRTSVDPKYRKKIYSFHLGKNLGRTTIDQLINAEDMANFIEALKDTPYGPMFRSVYSEFQKDRRTSVFELELDRFWIKYIENFALRTNTTVGPIIRYLLELEYEVRNINSVLKGLELPGGKELARQVIICSEGDL